MEDGVERRPSGVQRFFRFILPRKAAAQMEKESREWMIRCPCGHARSVWELGGVRYKAKGNPRRYMRCEACGERTWHRFERETGGEPRQGSAGEPGPGSAGEAGQGSAGEAGQGARDR